jgi:undecaprenyl-phosphate galactose phosphotransferase
MLTSIISGKSREVEIVQYPFSLFRRLACTLGLIFGDALAFATGYLLFRAGRPMPEFVLPTAGGTPDLATATDLYLIMCAVFIAVRYVLGDYSQRQLFWDGARATTNTLALVSIPDVMMVAKMDSIQFFLPMILSWLFLVPAVPLYRQVIRLILRSLGLWNIPTALIGTGPKACKAYKGLRNALTLGFDVQFLIAGPEQNETPPRELLDVRRITGSDAEAVAEILEAQGCRQIIVSAEDAQEYQICELIRGLIGSEINVAVIPSLHGLPLFGLRTNYLFGQDLLLLQLRNNLARIPSQILKRMIDFIGPIVILLLTFPIWVAIMLAIKLHDRGPIFYWQNRVGRHGRIFPCIKFRTMAVNADEVLERWREEEPEIYAEFLCAYKLRSDPRVTRPGKWLRRTSLDELPQLLNVLVGHMSMVGPRPVPLSQLREQYGSAARLYLQVRPGMTGLWQVSGRNDTSNDERVVYDEWYILNWSLWYDLVILIQTFRIVFSARGAY